MSFFFPSLRHGVYFIILCVFFPFFVLSAATCHVFFSPFLSFLVFFLIFFFLLLTCERIFFSLPFFCWPVTKREERGISSCSCRKAVLGSAVRFVFFWRSVRISVALVFNGSGDFLELIAYYLSTFFLCASFSPLHICFSFLFLSLESLYKKKDEIVNL